MKQPVFALLVFLATGSAQGLEQVLPLEPPLQDQGLPYTRSSLAPAMERLSHGVAVFPGSRYAVVFGQRVRLSETDLLHAEARSQDSGILVPAEFAALMESTNAKFPPIPGDLSALADRWVYAPSESGIPLPETEAWVNFEEVAAKRGWKAHRHAAGFWYAGPQPLKISDTDEKALVESIVTLFDTPDSFADPDIATRSIPSLARQGKWTDHVRATPEQIDILKGPGTVWPTAPRSAFDDRALDVALLGSKVPAPGVYPRVLFSPGDVEALAERVRASKVGRMSLIEMEHLFQQSWWDGKTSDGQIFRQLASGQLEGLTWKIDRSKSLTAVPHQFEGQQSGVHSSHVAYVPECLTAMALHCLLTGNDSRGSEVAAAIANYYRLREPLLDEWLVISDSEFGSSLRQADGSLIPLQGDGARTHWRNVHAIVAHMNLGLSLDFAGKWMNEADRDTMRRIIAKATYGRRSHGQDGSVRFRDVNWTTWDLTQFLALAAIEGLPGFDAEAYAAGAETVRAFCDWGIDPDRKSVV